MSTTIITKPKIEIEPSLLRKLKYQTEEIGQVVLHFLYQSPDSTLGDSLIRIWPTTYLYAQNSAHKSELVHIENISYYPQWYLCKAGSENHFTLIFSGLPKSCTKFDFIEHCTNQAGAFKVHGINRNDSDIYYLKIE